MSATDELSRLTRMIRAADDALETPLESSAGRLQEASGDADDKRVRKAAEVLDHHTREDYLRTFEKDEPDA